MSVILSQEQINAINLPLTGACSIKGIAGSGKTTVGIQRFLNLLKNSTGEKLNILFVTYQRTLINYIEHLIEKETSQANTLFGYTGEYEINSIDSMMLTAFKDSIIAKRHNLVGKNISNENESYGIFIKALENVRKNYPELPILSSENFTFLRNEVDYINCNNIYSLSEYQVFDRKGRGRGSDKMRLIKKSKTRQAIYELRKIYGALLLKNNMIDWHVMRMIAYLHVKNNPVKKYTHLIIDESQDLSRVQIDFLKYFLDHKKSNSGATFLYDSAQSIYLTSWLGNRQNLKSLGIRTKSSTVLKRNFRTTAEIQTAAQALLNADQNFNQEVTPEIINRSGIKPVYACLKDENTQAEYIVDVVNSLSSDFNLNDIIICSRTRNDLLFIKSFLEKKGINADIVGMNKASFGKDQIRLMTLHSVKGIESEVVIVSNVNNNKLPLQSKKLEEEQKAERSLMYVAMTRATKYLYITAHGVPSRYINDIGAENLDLFDISQWHPGNSLENPETQKTIQEAANKLEAILEEVDLLTPVKRSSKEYKTFAKNIFDKRHELQNIIDELGDIATKVKHETVSGKLLNSIFVRTEKAVCDVDELVLMPHKPVGKIKQELKSRLKKFTPLSIQLLATTLFSMENIDNESIDELEWGAQIVNVSRCLEKELYRVLTDKLRIDNVKNNLYDMVEAASNQTGEIKAIASDLNNLTKVSKKGKNRKNVLEFRKVRNDSAHHNSKRIDYNTLKVIKDKIIEKKGILERINNLL